jgi:uncharacterized protein YndB with AHSA1/START domain
MNGTAPKSDHVAPAEMTIGAPPDKVWQALTNSDSMKEVMFGSTVTTDWTVGSPITFSGEWNGKPFKDTGKILAMDRPKVFRATHIAGSDPSHTEHEVTYELSPQGDGTRVTVRQTNNGSAEAKTQSEKNWAMMLANLKKVAER